MCFDRIIKIVETAIPLVTVIVSALFIPNLLEKWKCRQLRCCYKLLFSYYDKICRSLGTKTFYYEFHEVRFESDSDIESLVKSDQDATPPITQPYWRPTNTYNIKTALNIARIKTGLEQGKFYYSRHFYNDKHGELLITLIIIKNCAEIRAFKRGDWEFPKTKKHSKRKSRFRGLKTRFFGYKRDDYFSVMLV